MRIASPDNSQAQICLQRLQETAQKLKQSDQSEIDRDKSADIVSIKGDFRVEHGNGDIETLKSPQARFNPQGELVELHYRGSLLRHDAFGLGDYRVDVKTEADGQRTNTFRHWGHNSNGSFAAQVVTAPDGNIASAALTQGDPHLGVAQALKDTCTSPLSMGLTAASGVASGLAIGALTGSSSFGLAGAVFGAGLMFGIAFAESRNPNSIYVG